MPADERRSQRAVDGRQEDVCCNQSLAGDARAKVWSGRAWLQQLEAVAAHHVGGFGRAKRQLHLTKYGLSDTWGVIFNNG